MFYVQIILNPTTNSVIKIEIKWYNSYEYYNMVNTENDTRFSSSCLGSIILLVYQGFGITYLVKNYHSPDPCIASHIWVYVLISLILTLSNSGVMQKRREDYGSFLLCLFCSVGFINLGFSIWGGMELMHPSCDNSKENALWKFGFLTFILQTIGAASYFLCGCCIVLWDEYTITEEGDNESI